MKWYSDSIASLLDYIVIHSVENWHIHSHTRFYPGRKYRTDSIQWIFVIVIAIYPSKVEVYISG